MLGNVEVGKNVYIGANSTITKIKIGKGAIIGAGSVVIRDVKDFDMVVGIPANLLKSTNMSQISINNFFFGIFIFLYEECGVEIIIISDFSISFFL